MLRRLDFDSYFSTVSGRELQEFGETFAEVSSELQAGHRPKEERRISEFMRSGQGLLDKLSSYPLHSVIAEPALTREFASATRALVEIGSESGALGVLRILAVTHPDWLEPMGMR